MNPFAAKGYVEVNGQLVKRPNAPLNGPAPAPAVPYVSHSTHYYYHSVKIDIDPMGAPRLTRQDKWRGLWKKAKPMRPCVRKYFDFRDKVRAAVGDIPRVPTHIELILTFPIPDSWSKKKRASALFHCQRPDADNCAKAILDALFLEDGGVACLNVTKLWGEKGSIIINY